MQRKKGAGFVHVVRSFRLMLRDLASWRARYVPIAAAQCGPISRTESHAQIVNRLVEKLRDAPSRGCKPAVLKLPGVVTLRALKLALLGPPARRFETTLRRLRLPGVITLELRR